MPAPPDHRRADRLSLLALIGLLVLAYWPIVHCGFIWDDDDYVTQNPVLRSTAGIARIWFEPTSLPQYYPVVHTTFWLEYRIWGATPIGYHIVNALLHLASSVVLLGLLRRLAVPGALFAALLFAAHPVQAESVAWITERKNVLSLLLMLLAARHWLAFRDAGGTRTYVLATLCFVGALGSKTVTASLPAALLVVQWWRHARLTRKDVTSLLPWFALGAASGLFTAWLEVAHVRASGDWQLHGGERLLVAGRAPWFYLGSLVWPFGLCFSYERWQLSLGDPLQWAWVVATLAAIGIPLAAQRRIGRGPAAVLLLFGGMLVPALGFFDVYPFRFSYVADHFQYHATTAALAGIAALAATHVAPRLPRRATIAVAATVLVGLAVLTSLHTRTYRDLETSWRAVLDRNPDSMLALVNLGGLFLARGEAAAAEPLFQRCLERHPDNHEAIANLGQIAHLRFDYATARQRYERSLELRPDQPAVLRNFAELHLAQGNPGAAVPLARHAVELDPDFLDGYRTLCTAENAVGHHTEAIAAADWVLKRTPDAVDTRLRAAQSLLALGRFEPALQNAAALLQKTPGLVPAQDVFVHAFAAMLVRQPASGIAAAVARTLQGGGLDAGSLVPKLQQALRDLGAPAHADALVR